MDNPDDKATGSDPLDAITQPVKDAADKLQNGGEQISDLAGKGIDYAEQKLDDFTNKADGVFSALDSFFKKF